MASNTAATEVRDLDDAELLVRLREAKEELFNLRFQMATGSLTNPQRVRECKKDVARIKTLLCERQLKAAE